METPAEQEWTETKAELEKLVHSSLAIRLFMILWFFTAFCALCWIGGMTWIYLMSPAVMDTSHIFQYPNHGKPIYATAFQAKFTSYSAIGFQIFLLAVMPLASVLFYFNDSKFRQFAKKLYSKPKPKS